MSRSEYQKKYRLLHANELREYKRDWMRAKRGSFAPVKKQKSYITDNPLMVIDLGIPKAKSKCVLCLRPINKNDYIKNGNYCMSCILSCTHLSQITDQAQYDLKSELFTKSLMKSMR